MGEIDAKICLKKITPNSTKQMILKLKNQTTFQYVNVMINNHKFFNFYKLKCSNLNIDHKEHSIHLIHY